MRTLCAMALFTVLVAAPGALATTIHGTYVGTNVTYNGLQETTQSPGDPEPLFGAPLLVGDQLLFFPSLFTATATGADGSDTTLSYLQTTITANNPSLTTIDQIRIDEFGDVLLTGVGTPVTNASVSMSGFVTVLQTTTGPCLLGPSCTIGFTGTLTPSGSYSLPGDGGPPAILWSGSVLVDIASQIPNATMVQFGFNNQLDAFSESGTSATIQKKVVDGPAVTITVIPEPATVSLLGIGLLGLVLLKRSGAR